MRWIGEARPVAQVSLAVVGVRFANADKTRSNRRFEILLCKPGDQVELRPEPRNKVDPQAVAVFSERGVQIGYLPAERAPRIGQLIGQGREVRAVFQAEVEHGAWIRLAFDGEAPVLPDIAEMEQSERDWWPDEVWPDE